MDRLERDRRVGGPGDGVRNGGDRRDWSRGDVDRRDGSHTDGNRRWGDGRQSDGRGWDRRDNDRRDYSRWERGRYPSAYFSTQRYRHYWRPPANYYVRVWSFGDFLPRGWYGPQYYLSDPWNYDLPLAPPGYDWVRVGYDALLIDQYNGRVVQVVRNVFW